MEQAHGTELARGLLSLGYAPACNLHDANQAWARAFKEALAIPGAAATAPERSPAEARDGSSASNGWEDVRAFVSSLIRGDTGRARVALEKALESLPGRRDVPLPDRYRIIALFVEAYREFEQRNFLDSAETRALMDLDDIRTAEGATGLALAARARFASLSEAARRAPRWSGPVARAMSFVKDNFSRQISLESAAAEVPLSPSHLSRLFVEETGRGFSDFLIEIRIERAKELLSEPGASIKQVSAACGYPDPNYFSRLFKKVTGSTPTAFASDPREGSDANQ